MEVSQPATPSPAIRLVGDTNEIQELGKHLAYPADQSSLHAIDRVNYPQILGRVKSLPIYEWQYPDQKRRHIGPLAQDFHRAFQLGNDQTTIANVDIDGVSLAAIKCLIIEMEHLKRELYNVKAKLRQMNR